MLFYFVSYTSTKSENGGRTPNDRHKFISYFVFYTLYCYGHQSRVIRIFVAMFVRPLYTKPFTTSYWKYLHERTRRFDHQFFMHYEVQALLSRYVTGSMLPTSCYRLHVTGSVLSALCYKFYGTVFMLPVLCYRLYATGFMLPVLCYRLYVTGSMLPALCYRFYVTGSMSPALCYRLRVTGFVLPASCYRLHVTSALLLA